MRKSIVGLLVCFVLIACVPSVGATDLVPTAWSDKEVKITSSVELDSLPEEYPCEGDRGFIEVKGLGQFNDACIQGNAPLLRLARFTHAGICKYAVAYPSSSDFYEVREICSYPRCVYSSEADILIDHILIPSWRYEGVLYKDFSKNLVRHIDPSTLAPYFQLQSSLLPPYIMKIGDYTPSVEATALSQNGKWALFELKSYGMVLLNTETQRTRRIIAPGAEYGLGHDPMFELAVSNDGREVAVSGRGAGISVVEVNNTCGDQLVQGMNNFFSHTTEVCTYASLNSDGVLNGLRYAQSPRFDEEGKQLRIAARYTNGRIVQLTLSPYPMSTKSGIAYIALGDSYTSGEGEEDDSFYQSGTTDPFLKCHVSTRSYPYLLGNAWRMSAKSVACSGAQTLDILGSVGYLGQAQSLEYFSEAERTQLKASALDSFRRGVLPQRAFVTAYQPAFISIGIGGNDAGLLGKLTGCLSIGTCEWAEDPIKRYATSQEMQSIYPKIREVIKNVRNDSPVSQIAIVGYPQIINATNTAHCDVVTGTLLNVTERTFMHETIHYLNEIVRAAAAAENVAYVDIEQSLYGHELCGEQDSSAMNALRFGDDIAPIHALPDITLFGSESFHPTYKGHALIAQSILSRYPSTNLISPCISTCVSTSIPQPSDYWALDENKKSEVKAQIEANSLSNPVMMIGDRFSIKSPSLFFVPGSKVALELHSTPVLLGETNAKEDGSIEFSAMLSEEIPAGYHVLHALGSAPSGEAIDVYRTVYIESNHKNDSGGVTSLKTSLPSSGEVPDNADHQVSSANTQSVRGASTFNSYPSQIKETNKAVVPAMKHLSLFWIIGGGALLIIMISLFWLWFSSRHSNR